MCDPKAWTVNPQMATEGTTGGSGQVGGDSGGGGGGAATRSYRCFQCGRTVIIIQTFDFICPNCSGRLLLEEFETPSPSPPPSPPHFEYIDPPPFFPETPSPPPSPPNFPYIDLRSFFPTSDAEETDIDFSDPLPPPPPQPPFPTTTTTTTNQPSNTFSEYEAHPPTPPLTLPPLLVLRRRTRAPRLPSSSTNWEYDFPSVPELRPPAEGLQTIKMTEELVLAWDCHQCAVCMESFELNHELKQLPCKHAYHTACILRWMEMHNSCPICRYQLTAI